MDGQPLYKNGGIENFSKFFHKNVSGTVGVG